MCVFGIIIVCVQAYISQKFGIHQNLLSRSTPQVETKNVSFETRIPEDAGDATM